MRLVDADDLKRIVKAYAIYDGLFNIKTYKDHYLTLKLIDKQQTIEAIPVSWLKKFLKNHPDLSYAITDGINNVLSLWYSRTEAEMEELIKELESIRDIGIVNARKDTETLHRAIGTLKQFTWRDPEDPPEEDVYVLLSYSNYSLPDIGEYRVDEEGNGAYYPGDDERSCTSFGLFVDGLMPLPKNVREA